MSKHDTKKKSDKIPVTEAGSDAALRHNPFAQLSGVGSGSAGGSTAQTAVPAAPVETTAPPAKSRGRLVLRREKKQRGGKTVVVVTGLRANAHLPESEIEKIAKQLRQQLGCGGSVERVPNDTVIVVQGDQPARVAELLRELGFKVDGVTQ